MDCSRDLSLVSNEQPMNMFPQARIAGALGGTLRLATTVPTSPAWGADRGAGALRRGGAPERIRTFDTWFRKPLLYPLSYGGVGCEQPPPSVTHNCVCAPQGTIAGGADHLVLDLAPAAVTARWLPLHVVTSTSHCVVRRSG